MVSACLIAWAPGAWAADIQKIEGTAAWDESDPVPRRAMLEVDLIDLNRDAEGTVISRMRFKPDNSAPLAFTLHYDAELVQRGQRYSLAARLVRGEEVLFRSTAPVPVLRTFQQDRPQITMHKVVPIVAKGTPVGESWTVTSIAGKAVLPYSRVTIAFNENGTLKGSFGCNRFKARYAIDGQKIDMKRFEPTNRGCQSPIMKQERSVRSAIRRTLTYARSDDTLRLLDIAGLETLRLIRQ